MKPKQITCRMHLMSIKSNLVRNEKKSLSKQRRLDSHFHKPTASSCIFAYQKQPRRKFATFPPSHSAQRPIRCRTDGLKRQAVIPMKLKLTLKNDGWKTTFFLGRPIFRGYVKFPECTHIFTLANCFSF